MQPQEAINGSPVAPRRSVRLQSPLAQAAKAINGCSVNRLLTSARWAYAADSSVHAFWSNPNLIPPRLHTYLDRVCCPFDDLDADGMRCSRGG